MIEPFEPDFALIERAVAGHIDRCGVSIQQVDRKVMVAHISFRQMAASLNACTRTVGGILRRQACPEVSWFYMKNLVDLCLLAIFVSGQPNKVFVTTSMVQHDAYLLGWTARRCWVVQHGHTYTDYHFPHPFSDVERIFALSPELLSLLEHSYSAQHVEMQVSIPLMPCPLPGPTVLLGSSFPNIDEEIRFCQALRSVSEVAILVKLHPHHPYDKRASDLISLCDGVVEAADNVGCSVFVSHSSSYKIHYEIAGIPTVSLAEEDGPDAAAKSVLDRLVALSN